MKKKTIFFPGCAVLLLCIVFSCQQDLNDVLLEENVAALTSKSTDDGDIDGGTLPEVVVTASYPLTFQFAPGPNTSFTSDPQPWWHELPPIDYSGPGGGSGGNPPGDNKPSSVKLAKNLIKFFPEGTKLTARQLEKLNEAYKKMLSHCAYKVMDDYIAKNGLFRGSIVLKESGGSIGLASLDPKGNLNFYGEENITATNLAHEWIHIYQIAFDHSRAPLDDEYKGMMEFELALLQDIIVYAEDPEQLFHRDQTDIHQNSSWLRTLDVDSGEMMKIEAYYKAWLIILFYNKKFPDKMTEKDFTLFLPYFENYSRTYRDRGYEFNIEKYSAESINTILGLISQSECFKNK